MTVLAHAPAPRPAASVGPAQVIREAGKIPPYTLLVTGDRGPNDWRLPEDRRTQIAILQVKPNQGFLLVTEASQGSAHFFEAKSRLTKAGFAFKVLVTEAGVLRQLYERDRYKTQREPEQASEGQSITSEFNKFIDECLAENVSDVHIEVRGESAVVKVRRHGHLVERSKWNNKHAIEMTTAMYNAMSDQDSASTSFNPRFTQQASITMKTSRGATKIRFQSVPAYPDECFDVVLRLQSLDAGRGFQSLEELGYETSHLQTLELMMSRPVGAIVIAGTTGSGKSTTIKNMLQDIAAKRTGIKIFTVEDPPEFLMPWATQIPVAKRKSEQENPFLEAMKATMRADPDVMMVGEIRDMQTAKLAVQMVESGHQIFTTVHADSAIGIVKRLHDIGVDSNTLSYPNFISGLIYQRLLPVLCPHCSIPFVPDSGPTKALAARLSLVLGPDADQSRIRVRGRGCDHCSGTGIVGRTACAEMLIPDRTLREHFANGRYEEAFTYWRGHAKHDQPSNMIGKTAIQHATLKMVRGDVSPIDLEGEFGMITHDNDAGGWDAAALLGIEAPSDSTGAHAA